MSPSRFPIKALSSPFYVRRSTFDVLRSTFDVLRSTFDVLRSTELPCRDEFQVGIRDGGRRGFGGYLTCQEGRRGLPEYGAPDGETGRGRAGGARGKPALDGRQIGGFAEDDLPAGGVGGDGGVDRPRAL